MNIPIALRSRNRTPLLDVTLRSVLSTKLPEGFELLILDDCSPDPITQQYLFTDDTIVLPEPFTWLTGPPWYSYMGKIQDIPQIQGIKSVVEVVQPESRKGVRGGIFWCVDYMMTRYPDAPAVIVTEADAVFHEDWYDALINGYEVLKEKPGPNGDTLGILTCYDRKGKCGKNQTGYGAFHRSVSRKGKTNIWSCACGIGGVNYLLTRSFYEAAIGSFKATYNPGQRSGDTTLQGVCGAAKFNIGVTAPSFCQHIGAESLAWPGKGWRYTKNFRKPFAFEAFDDEGWAYSQTWKS